MRATYLLMGDSAASMKALPERKGNVRATYLLMGDSAASMKALPERKGNSIAENIGAGWFSLNESPSGKEGKYHHSPSPTTPAPCLNESPSGKEGKLENIFCVACIMWASMKALPERKGNRPLQSSPFRIF